MDKITLGKMGEKYAENFLHAQNYKILTRNFRCRFGEIDIIAIDKSIDKSIPEQLVFVEVKTRRSSVFGEPQNAITHSKKQKIIKTSLHFLASTREKRPLSWRIDVIGIKLNKENKFQKITHIKNI